MQISRFDISCMVILPKQYVNTAILADISPQWASVCVILQLYAGLCEGWPLSCPHVFTCLDPRAIIVLVTGEAFYLTLFGSTLIQQLLLD